MLRGKAKWKPHKDQSTEAEHRGGATRSSVEASVMEVERRGCIVRLDARDQPAMGGILWIKQCHVLWLDNRSRMNREVHVRF